MIASKCSLTELFLLLGLMCGACLSKPDPLNSDVDTGRQVIKLRMPGVEPPKDDAYLCTALKMDEEVYITRFGVEGSADRAHHMILQGCSDLPSSEPYWECVNHATCAGKSRILFAWANNAPGASMPPSVGFRVGGQRSTDKYLVLQVHYARKLDRGVKDDSGLDVYVTSQPQKYLAGVMYAAAYPVIPPFQQKVHADGMCPISVDVPVTAFAYRVHAHRLGTVITGYKRDDKRKMQEIARGNPQWPQAFYDMKNLVELRRGDTVYVRCTYDSSDRNTTTYTGPTGADEMCNLYLMYYFEPDRSHYESCGVFYVDDENGTLFPADSDEPLPPNPVLEAYALHGHKHKKHQQVSASSGSMADFVHQIASDSSTAQ